MIELLRILLERLATCPQVKYANSWREQLLATSEEDHFLLRNSVLLEFASLTYRHPTGALEGTSEDYQIGNATIIAHCLTEHVKMGEKRVYTPYEFKTLVHRYLHRFQYVGTTLNFSPLVRVSETTEDSHDNLYDFRIEYVTRFHEIIQPVESEIIIPPPIDIRPIFEFRNG